MIEIQAAAPSIVALILGIVYRRSISDLIIRLARAKFSAEGVELETHKQLGKLTNQSQEMTGILREISRNIEKIADHEKPYTDYIEAFQDTEKRIRDCLEDNQKYHIREVDIKIIAVSMTFSWNFVAGKMPRILKDYPDARINVEII
jgi:hypothetical protein